VPVLIIIAGDSYMSSLIEQLKTRIIDPRHATEGADVIAPTIYPVASEATLHSAAQALGFALPQLLQRIYLEVGNGGFGPGYGLLGIAGGATDDTGRNIVDLYYWFRELDPDDPTWQWPAQLVPLCHLGCGMYACIDCFTTAGTIIWFEPNPREPGDPLNLFLIPVASSLEEWLIMWLGNQDWQGPAYVQSELYRMLERWQNKDIATCGG
jgi:hypothetical protein